VKGEGAPPGKYRDAVTRKKSSAPGEKRSYAEYARFIKRFHPKGYCGKKLRPFFYTIKCFAGDLMGNQGKHGEKRLRPKIYGEGIEGSWKQRGRPVVFEMTSGREGQKTTGR